MPSWPTFNLVIYSDYEGSFHRRDMVLNPFGVISLFFTLPLLPNLWNQNKISKRQHRYPSLHTLEGNYWGKVEKIGSFYLRNDCEFGRITRGSSRTRKENGYYARQRAHFRGLRRRWAISALCALGQELPAPFFILKYAHFCGRTLQGCHNPI